MKQTDPTKYTDVSHEQYDRFKALAKSHGMNISGNTDNVEFDRIPVRVDYTPEEKTLNFTITEPHWLAPGVTAGALHQIVAAAMDINTNPALENPQVSHQRDVQQKMTTVHDKDPDDEKNGDHPAHHSKHATATHTHGK